MSLPDYVKKTGPGPYPEQIVAEQGIQNLPDCITDDDTKSAHGCLKKLFDQFDEIRIHEINVRAANQELSDHKKRKLSNQIRRSIAPAAYLLASYLLQRSVYHFQNDNTDVSTLPLAKNMQDIMEAIKANESVKDLMRLFTLATVPGQISLERISVRGLPELKATVATSAIDLNHDLDLPLGALVKLKKSLCLARLQWVAVKIFVNWYEGRGKVEFLIVDVQQVKSHIDGIDRALAQIEKQVVK